MTQYPTTILTHEEMVLKLSEEATQKLLRNCMKKRIPVDYRIVAERRDHGYSYRLKPDETVTVAKIWELWTPGDDMCWVEFLDIDGNRYVEQKPRRWPHSATIEPEAHEG